MASGVAVVDDCIKAFGEIKMGHKWQYVIYRLSKDLKTIVVDERAPRETDYTTFVEKLRDAEKNQECRYAVFDVSFSQNDIVKEKLVFFAWSPDSASIKQKMLYASSKNALKSKLIGINIECQCSDIEDLKEEDILEKCKDRYN